MKSYVGKYVFSPNPQKFGTRHHIPPTYVVLNQLWLFLAEVLVTKVEVHFFSKECTKLLLSISADGNIG
jgi:hypothetical protein